MSETGQLADKSRNAENEDNDLRETLDSSPGPVQPAINHVKSVGADTEQDCFPLSARARRIAHGRERGRICAFPPSDQDASACASGTLSFLLLIIRSLRSSSFVKHDGKRLKEFHCSWRTSPFHFCYSTVSLALSNRNSFSDTLLTAPKSPTAPPPFPQNPFVTGSLVVRARSCWREKVSQVGRLFSLTCCRDVVVSLVELIVSASACLEAKVVVPLLIDDSDEFCPKPAADMGFGSIGAGEVCFLCGSGDAEPCDGECGGAVAACSARHLQVHRPPGLGRCLPFR